MNKLTTILATAGLGLLTACGTISQNTSQTSRDSQEKEILFSKPIKYGQDIYLAEETEDEIVLYEPKRPMGKGGKIVDLDKDGWPDVYRTTETITTKEYSNLWAPAEKEATEEQREIFGDVMDKGRFYVLREETGGRE